MESYKMGRANPVINDEQGIYRELYALCRKYKKPVLVAEKGKKGFAAMSIEQYKKFEELAARDELYRLLDEGYQAIEKGDCRPYEEFMREMRENIANGTLYEEIEEITAREELYRALDEGLRDVKEGRVRPAEEFMRELREKIANGTL